jgi:hypothetical protein
MVCHSYWFKLLGGLFVDRRGLPGLRAEGSNLSFKSLDPIALPIGPCITIKAPQGFS